MEVIRDRRLYRVSRSRGCAHAKPGLRGRLARVFHRFLGFVGLSVLAAVLLLVMGCSAQTSAARGSGSQQSFTVKMTDANRFEPADLTVPKGATVTWMNTGQAVHTVTDDPSKAVNKSDAALPSGAQPWDSGTIPGGASFSKTFDVPGQYTYFCVPHESLGMVGHITVTE